VNQETLRLLITALAGVGGAAYLAIDDEQLPAWPRGDAVQEIRVGSLGAAW
jgi:hypothetical protein